METAFSVWHKYRIHIVEVHLFFRIGIDKYLEYVYSEQRNSDC